MESWCADSGDLTVSLFFIFWILLSASSASNLIAVNINSSQRQLSINAFQTSILTTLYNNTKYACRIRQAYFVLLYNVVSILVWNALIDSCRWLELMLTAIKFEAELADNNIQKIKNKLTVKSPESAHQLSMTPLWCHSTPVLGSNYTLSNGFWGATKKVSASVWHLYGVIQHWYWGQITPSQMGSEALPKRCQDQFDTFMVSLETTKGVIKTRKRCPFDTFLVAPQNPKFDTYKGVNRNLLYFECILLTETKQ